MGMRILNFAKQICEHLKKQYPCTCNEAWTSRNLKDPNCKWHETVYWICDDIMAMAKDEELLKCVLQNFYKVAVLYPVCGLFFISNFKGGHHV